VDCLGVAGTIDSAKQTRCSVVLNQRLSFLFVSCEPRLYGFHVVVSTMHKFRLGMKVANVVVPWWLKVDVVNLATDRTVSSSRHSLLEIVRRHVDQNRDNAVALFCCQLFQTRGLLRSARKAVEDIAVARILLRRAFLDDSDCQIIRNELSALHDFPYFLREWRMRSLQGAKDIPRGNL